jgi:hypothetical protein
VGVAVGSGVFVGVSVAVGVALGRGVFVGNKEPGILKVHAVITSRHGIKQMLPNRYLIKVLYRIVVVVSMYKTILMLRWNSYFLRKGY